jgi:hypothetical protein
VTSAVTSINQETKTAEVYSNISRRDFQFGVGDADYFTLSTSYLNPSNI